MKDQKKVKQGKRNKRMGAEFERRTRKDLESKGWIVSKWQNNVDLGFFCPNCQKEIEPGVLTNRFVCDCIPGKYYNEQSIKKGKCIPAKPGRFRMMQTGFPDFVVFPKVGRLAEMFNEEWSGTIFIECKTNGYLSKEEKLKAQWYLDNNYCSKFFIAYKEKEGRRVVVKYKDFEGGK